MISGTKLEDLPEDILCGIFSRLPMRDAARACASCSTLLRVWRRHEHLVFDEDTLGLRLLPEEEDELFDDDDLEPHRKDVLEKKKDELARDFVRFVDATMLRRRSDTAIGTLSVKFAYLQQRRDVAFVDRWVRFAIESATTRRLELDFLAHQKEPCSPDSLCYDFPSSLLLTPAAKVLEQLLLRWGCLRWPSQEYLQLTNLATIVLDSVRVTSRDLERFLYSCHKLQSLELKYCDELMYFKVPPRLRQLGYLALRNCRSVTTVDLSDSRVASLTFVTANRGPSLLGSVPPAPNVTRASFHILAIPVEPSASTFEATKLARLMPGLESLSLRVPMRVKVVTSPRNKYSHLKRLELWKIMDGNSRQRDDFIFLHQFLDAAPALESLSLHVKSSAPALDASQMPLGVDFFRKHPSSSHLSLKTVTITGFDADLASLELLLYILENARSLQQMSLDPSWYRDSEMAQMMPPDRTRSWKMELAREAIRKYIAPRVSGRVALEVF